MKPVAAASDGGRILEEELRLLARVSAALSELSARAAGAPDFDQDLLDLRDQLAEAKPEDIAALTDQMMRISAIAQRYGKGRDLPVNPESPYFAHLRLEEDERVRDVLIGKRGFVDRDRQVQIVDWRNAPVSRIYYRYEEGDDYEEHFGERVVEGVIKARRSLTIERSRLRRVGCPQATLVADETGRWYEAEPVAPARLTGGQGTAARPPALRQGGRGSRLGVHSGPALRADKHLPEIAALIDPTQFELISRPESGPVVLQGGAGSGKTTVALHRVAYLNYSMPGRFRPDRMLVVVLGAAMVRYVERVLPSLGVTGVPVVTAQEWLRRMRRRTVPRAPNEYTEDAPAAVLKLKKHPFMLRLLEDHVGRQLVSLESQLGKTLGGLPAGELVLARWRELARLAPVPRCEELRAWLRKEPVPGVTSQQAGSTLRRIVRRLRDLLADWSEILTDRALLGAAVERWCPGSFSARDLNQVVSWCARQLDEWPAVHAGGSDGSGAGARAPGHPSPMDQPGGARYRSAASFPALRSGSEDNPYISLDGQDEGQAPLSGRLDPPDDGLLLRLCQLKWGALRLPNGRNVSYEHLVIDEAQDLAAPEIKVLVECTSRLRSVTLAGDTAQRLAFDNSFVDWETLLAEIDLAAATNRTLSLGYRSTEEIMELAETLAGGSLQHREARAARSGAAVELHTFNEQGEAVAMLGEALRSLAAREPRASVALITRYPEQARQHAAALIRAEVPGVRLVGDQDFAFKAGVEVTDIAQVKGLEFDYVILLDVTASNYPDTLESRHLLYIGATRCAHQLWLVSVGAPSSLIPCRWRARPGAA